MVAQTLQALRRREKQIRYSMIFVQAYPDGDGETDRTWGRHRRYVIEGEGLSALRRPINIAETHVSSKNYGQSDPFVYVDPRDEKALRKGGYFDTLRDA